METITTRGDRELALRFETFPADTAKRLGARITALTEDLAAQVEAAAPLRTGKLRGEVKTRVFISTSDRQRIAGYVEIYAPDRPEEYAKAATLEYGSNKRRRAFERTTSIAARLNGSKRRILGRLSRPVHIAAYMYLRRPLDEMRPEIEAAIEEELAGAAAEGGEL